MSMRRSREVTEYLAPTGSGAGAGGRRPGRPRLAHAAWRRSRGGQPGRRGQRRGADGLCLRRRRGGGDGSHSGAGAAGQDAGLGVRSCQGRPARIQPDRRPGAIADKPAVEARPPPGGGGSGGLPVPADHGPDTKRAGPGWVPLVMWPGRLRVGSGRPSRVAPDAGLAPLRRHLGWGQVPPPPVCIFREID
jgi:hypothetical protein